MSTPGAAPALRSGLAGLPETTDVLVVGLGITGAGVALDAAARGLDVVAVDAHDVAFGTSRWSSKLVHGGLRYLAKGQLGVAHESAVERGILMERAAPHLVHALPMLLPLGPGLGRAQGLLTQSGLLAGDALRLAARTRRATLPRPRRLNVTEALALAPGLRREGLRGALLSWDGQLEDDVRLVLAVARTAVREGARVHTRVRAHDLGTHGAPGATLTDTVTGESLRVRARVVVNATGVWADRLAPDVRLRPSRGTHVVLPGSLLPSRCAVMAPVPGAANRFVFALPQPGGDLVYAGLTDEPVESVDDVPVAPESDIDFLLATLGRVLARPPRREDVLGAYAGLRPLLRPAQDAAGTSADLSRRHAVLPDAARATVTVVGGKLTTYRRMAQDAVDAAVWLAGLDAAPCRTTTLPLVGAGTPEQLAGSTGPDRLVRRFGTEAGEVVRTAHAASGIDVATLRAPAAAGSEVTLAELVFGVTHEAARGVEDLLERRTRVSLVPADVPALVPAAERALRHVPPG
jgi:glycerol-3-phosphate dehydrogenase